VTARRAGLALLAALAVGALVWGVGRLSAGDDRATAVDACGKLGEPGRRPLPGFGEVPFQVVALDGRVVSGCAMLAATTGARAQGMMGERDLAGYDAMAFRFPAPVDGRFHMARTLVPLDIAFVDAGGEVISTAAMVPCGRDDPSECPAYGAGAPFLHALEVLEGGLEPLGIAQGAIVTFDDAGDARDG
jgi:uncharacterized membrane protein (UPF0127 family)